MRIKRGISQEGRSDATLESFHKQKRIWDTRTAGKRYGFHSDMIGQQNPHGTHKISANSELLRHFTKAAIFKGRLKSKAFQYTCYTPLRIL